MVPVLLKIGPIGIYSFGLMMAAGFFAAYWVLRAEYRRRGAPEELASSVIFGALVGGILGAKLYYVLFYGGWSDLFSGAGLAWYGGLLGGTVAVWWVLRRAARRVDTHSPTHVMLRWIDPIGPALLIGQMFGRIGCFLSGDGDYGPPSDLPWAIAFPHGTVPSVVDGVVYRVHPTMLYDVVLLGLGFLILWSLRKRWTDRPLRLFSISLFWLAGERFVTEFWRLTRVFSFTSTPMGWESRALADQVHGTAWQGRLLIDGISEFQFWSLITMGVALGLLWWSHRMEPKPVPDAS